MADGEERPTKPVARHGRVAKPRMDPSDSRFEHLRKIGRGGMGRVVEARDMRLGR